MSKFVPRWSRWNTVEDPSSPDRESKTGNLQACKTSKSPFAGFAGGVGGLSAEINEPLDHSEVTATPSPEQVAAMRLSTFARAGLVVRLFSRVLDCDVLFVSDNVSDNALADLNLPVYRAAELRKLALFRPKPRDLRRIHEVKTIFNGAITDVRPNDEDPRDL